MYAGGLLFSGYQVPGAWKWFNGVARRLPVKALHKTGAVSADLALLLSA